MTERQRAILEEFAAKNPADMCAGCGTSGVDDWRIARVGAWFTHGKGAKRCRFPCVVERGAKPCEHIDCVELRAALKTRRKSTTKADDELAGTVPSAADPGQVTMASYPGRSKVSQNEPRLPARAPATFVIGES